MHREERKAVLTWTELPFVPVVRWGPSRGGAGLAGTGNSGAACRYEGHGERSLPPRVPPRPHQASSRRSATVRETRPVLRSGRKPRYGLGAAASPSFGPGVVGTSTQRRLRPASMPATVGQAEGHPAPLGGGRSARGRVGGHERGPQHVLPPQNAPR